MFLTFSREQSLSASEIGKNCLKTLLSTIKWHHSIHLYYVKFHIFIRGGKGRFWILRPQYVAKIIHHLAIQNAIFKLRDYFCFLSSISIGFARAVCSSSFLKTSQYCTGMTNLFANQPVQIIHPWIVKMRLVQSCVKTSFVRADI